MTVLSRLAVAATIRRAMMSARGDLESLDAASRAQLERMYRAAVADITTRLADYADDAGNLRAEALGQMLREAKGRLQELTGQRDVALNTQIQQAAMLGVRPWAQEGAGIAVGLGDLADKAARYVQNFVADDGLQLSDRLWRLDRHARQAVEEQIESAVLQGQSASRAAREFLARGEIIPGDVARKIDAARADRVAGGLGAALLRDEDSAYSNALRVFRTEINRAHGEAFRAAMEASPEVIGERFVLSPAHPRPDICDLHASANLHGLGPGVYPVGRSPWPAHPNTLSYLEPVFRDEVTESDRASKTSRIEWLQSQAPGMQVAVLGQHKAAALREGLLRENQIATPWRVLKKRLAGAISGPPSAVPPVPVRPLPPFAPPPPTPVSFQYERFQRLKNTQEAEEFVRTAGIARTASFKGLAMNGLQEPLRAMQEVTERFGLAPLAGVGPASRLTNISPAQLKNASAAILTSASDRATGSGGVFHIPLHFGNQQRAAEHHQIAARASTRQRGAAELYLNEKTGPRLPQIDPEARKRFARMKDGDYGWSISTMSEPSRAATLTTYHEYGHVLHILNAETRDEINRFLAAESPRRGGWQKLLSEYSGTNDDEFVAESFSVYMGLPAAQHYRIHPALLAIFKKWDKKP